MKISKINTLLASLSETEFIYLGLAIDVAERIRSIVKEFTIDKEEVCRALDVSPLAYKRMINGAWSFDLRFISKLQAFHYKKLMEKKIADAEKQSQVIEFPAYKHSGK